MKNCITALPCLTWSTVVLLYRQTIGFFLCRDLWKKKKKKKQNKYYFSCFPRKASTRHVKKLIFTLIVQVMQGFCIRRLKSSVLDSWFVIFSFNLAILEVGSGNARKKFIQGHGLVECILCNFRDRKYKFLTAPPPLHYPHKTNTYTHLFSNSIFQSTWLKHAFRNQLVSG